MGKKTTYVNTKAPTDLQIKIDTTINSQVKKAALSSSWSRADDDYGAGQQLSYQFYAGEDEPDWRGKGAPSATTVKLDSGDTSKTFSELNLTSYYPTTNAYLNWVHVEVIGRRSSRTTDKKKYVYNWSGPAARSVNLEAPPEPEMGEVQAGTTNFSKKFPWVVPEPAVWIGVDYKDKVTKRTKRKKKNKVTKAKKVKYKKDDQEIMEMFYDTEWQSILVDNIAQKDFDAENDINWSSSASTIMPNSWQTGTQPAGEKSSVVTITETNTSWTGNYSYTRHFRVRSRGMAGWSDWEYGDYTYYNASVPPAPSSAIIDGSGNVTVSDNESVSEDFPPKYISHQYLTAVPATSIHDGVVTISPPPGGSWVEAMKLPGGQMEATYHTEPGGDDTLTWTRKVFIGMDDSSVSGEPTRATPESIPTLSAPTGITISDIDTQQKRMTVSATNNSEVPSSFLIVYCRQDRVDEKSVTKSVGLIPHGESSGTTIQVPEEWDFSKVAIGVEAVLGNYKRASDGSYTVEPVYMSSGVVWDGGTLPVPPTDVSVKPVTPIGTVCVEWKWTWTDADIAEISWSDNPLAWVSTSQPQAYTITNTHNGLWYISGLSVGTYYVRVRLGKTTNDVTTWSMYSDPAKTVKIVSTPDRPYVMVTPKIITPDQSVKVTWVYGSEDGAPLKQVDIARSTDLKSIISTTNKTSVTLSRNDLKWNPNDTISLRIKTTSAENMPSEWSTVTKDSTFKVVPLPNFPTITYGSGWNPNKQVVVGTSTTVEECIQSLPFTFTVSGIASNNYISVEIRRESGMIVKTPDESERPVYAKDLVYFRAGLRGSQTITITQKDLIGTLDDNKYYHLRVAVTDEYGQTPAGGTNNDGVYDKRFRVVWDHKAIKPTAIITVDREYDAAFIKTVRPSGYASGDVCDIYRMSVDKPELIIEGAEMPAGGQTYVDEYPTIGEFGGYKIVYRTFNGDIRTAGGYAETEYVGEDYALTEFMSIIDFGKDSVALRYDLSLSNSWKKDFTETKYLGGAVQGDWNPAVSRTGTMKCTVVIHEDPFLQNPQDTIEAMRRLAVYAGICHIRTPDGSNFYANVDVQEDREEKYVNTKATFSLSITKVDSPNVVDLAKTKEEWDADREEDE